MKNYNHTDEVKDDILKKAGVQEIYEATNEYILVSAGDDQAEGVFEKGTGRLVFTFDMLHGDSSSSGLALAKALGVNIREVDFFKLFPEMEEREEVSRSNQVPNLQKTQEAVRKMR